MENYFLVYWNKYLNILTFSKLFNFYIDCGQVHNLDLLIHQENILRQRQSFIQNFILTARKVGCATFDP